MSQFLIRNARVFDGTAGECAEGMDVLVQGNEIVEVSEHEIDAPQAHVINVKGRTLMPGLIDAHVHAYASHVNVQLIEAHGKAYRTAHAARMLSHTLDCGFTAVRDVAGGDYGLARAITDGLIRAPRFFYSGRALSMSGGHGDIRLMHDQDQSFCACGFGNALCTIVDGVDAVIRAARNELRRGAHCIKILASGGVGSPTDPYWMNQYREDEIRAVVNETLERRTYTCAHCHPASSIRRCIECGVRCIEHGTLIDDITAELVASSGAFVVPTMVIMFVLMEEGPRLGFPPQSQAKLVEVFEQALAGMELMRSAGVKVGFGTDLLGDTYVHQCREFLIRREVFTPVEILRQATSVNAEILGLTGKLGCIGPGAYADLLVVDGNPLQDIGLLAASGQNLPLIMQAGNLVKCELT